MSWGTHAAASSTAPTPRGERTRPARFRSAPAEPVRRLTTSRAHPRSAVFRVASSYRYSCQTRFVRPFRALFVVAALCSLYSRLLRRRILTWGATEAEAGSRLPGDELLEDADGVSTRAVWIDAPATAVWPWVAQMGPEPRGGAYTYDWIENLLGLGMHSVDHVLPEYQHPQIGDTITLGSNRMRIELVDLEHALAWRSDDGNWVWTFVVEERDGRTRLISRNRFRLPKLLARIGMLPMEPGSLVMERKMLLGMKQRGERLASAPTT